MPEEDNSKFEEVAESLGGAADWIEYFLDENGIKYHAEKKGDILLYDFLVFHAQEHFQVVAAVCHEQLHIFIPKFLVIPTGSESWDLLVRLMELNRSQLLVKFHLDPKSGEIVCTVEIPLLEGGLTTLDVIERAMEAVFTVGPDHKKELLKLLPEEPRAKQDVAHA